MNFVNYITIGCLLARLAVTFIDVQIMCFFSDIKGISPAASAFLKVINF